MAAPKVGDELLSGSKVKTSLLAHLTEKLVGLQRKNGVSRLSVQAVQCEMVKLIVKKV